MSETTDPNRAGARRVENQLQGGSNIPGAVKCTSCGEMIVPPEMPSLGWEPRTPGEPPRPADHVEHWACYLERVPRSPQPARLSGGP